MVPKVTCWEDLLWVSEEVDNDTGDFQYTMCVAVEDDTLYYGQLNKRKADTSFQDVVDCFTRIPDEDIFPRWPSYGLALTTAPVGLPSDVFVKRPRLALYDIFLKYKSVHVLAPGIDGRGRSNGGAQEISASKHRRILRVPSETRLYHGSRARPAPKRLDKLHEERPLDSNKDKFLESLKSAVYHLHSIGWAHNDLNPSNVFVAEDGKLLPL